MRSSLLLLPLLLAGCATTAEAPLRAPLLHVDTFGETRPRDVRTMIVVLHDDGTPGLRDDEATFAESIAGAVPGSAVIALLRPGYRNANGGISPGMRGAGTGDDYTLDRIEAIGDAIAALKTRYPQANTVVVGDAGGAAIAANLAGVRPDLVDGVVLVGCPCTLPEWRAHMERRTPAEPWEAPVDSLDPLKTAGGIAPDLRAAVIVGADDQITPVRFSRSYAEALSLRGIATDYRILPGRGHDILNDPEVIAATQRLAAELPARS